MKPQTVPEFFRALPDRFDADAADGVSTIYQFDLSDPDGGQYHLTVNDGRCSVEEGVHPAPDVTFAMSGQDCLAVLRGKLDGPAAFLSGRLRVSGDLGLAIQLKSLFPAVEESPDKLQDAN